MLKFCQAGAPALSKKLLSSRLILAIETYRNKLEKTFSYFFQTAFKVKTRHKLLMGAIGVLPEEQEAYDLVMKLSWILPTVVLVGALLDAMFVAVYMKFAHPWVGILSTEEPNNEQE